MHFYYPRLHKPVVKLPKIIGLFFMKLTCLVTTWELVYHYILKPARIPDKVLTDLITSGVTAGINFFFNTSSHVSWIADAVLPANIIKHHGRSIFYIYDVCNGLDLIVIYLGFIILLPASLKRKIAFTLGGIAALIIANIIRCILLYWIYTHYRQGFEMNHHYVFTFLMYLVIFCGWILFTKKEQINEVG